MSTDRRIGENEGGTRVLGLDGGVDALRESAEFRGPVEPLKGHEHANDHFALLYDDRAERLAAAVPFLRQGIDAGEKCLYVGDERSLETVADLLRDRGIDVDRAVETGALVFESVTDTYFRDGSFDPESMTEIYEAEIDVATAEFEALRVVAETDWIVESDVPVESFMEYESRINDLFDDADAIALCQYDRERFPAEELIEIVRVHPHLIYDTTVCHNVYYTPPSEFCGPDRPENELDRMLGTLRERAQAKASLHGQTETLRNHHALASRSDLSFDEKLGRFLEIGREYFHLDIGFLSHTATGRSELIDAVGDRELVKSGVTADPVEPYCRRVLESDGLVAVTDTPAAGWTGDRADDLDSFIGTTVTVEGERYGTLCFAAREGRDRPFSEAERTFLELTAQWVGYELEREQRHARLAALNEMSRDLMDAETELAIAETTVDHAAETLALPLTAVARYDRDRGRLETAARTERAVDELPTSALSEIPSGPLWEAFTVGETRVVDGDVSGTGDDVTEIAAVPLGSHGVFVTATEAPGGFCEAALEFVETTAATVETACGRADRERRLEEQNESLERLNRINDTIRSIGQSLVGASTRGEIESVVCEQLADVGPYELAWVGDHDSVTDEVTPREWAGAEKGYLDETTVTADERTTGRGPAGRAVRTREPQVVDNIVEDPDFEPWRQAALTRGYHASIALPLVYDEALYGVLNVYANQPGVFDDLERSVLAELADTIAYAINAVESKKALVSDEVTNLEFAVADEGLEIVDLARETGCELTVEGVVPPGDGRARAFISTRGITPEAVRPFQSDLPATDLSLISEYEGEDGPVCLFEATLSDGSLCETVRRHGGRPHTVTVEDGVATVVVELAADAAVREFVDVFTDAYPETELVAQRNRERPRRSPTELRAALTEDLTDRQLEVLQTAYFGGYFETPRGQTGSEVAESLGISQPTFNTHVRAAHRKLCRQLFETGSPGD